MHHGRMYHLEIQSMLLLDLHPAVVHFPIVLLFTTLFFDILGYFRPATTFRRISWWLLTGAVLATGAAVLSGYLAESLVRWPPAFQIPIQRMAHEGWWTLGISTGAWIVYGSSLRHPVPRFWMRAASTALLGLSVFFVAYTAKIGASMVFHPWLRMITPSRPQTLRLAWSLPDIFVGFGVFVIIGVVAASLGGKYRHRRPAP